jgi:Ca2+-binding RTX toxin-like protein
MAKIRTGDAGFNIGLLGADRARTFTASEDVFRLVFDDGDVLRLFGSYQFDAQGNLVGGTVNSFSSFENGAVAWTVSGLDAPALPVLDALFQEDLAPLIAQLLGGADTFIGGAGSDVMIGFGGDDVLRGNGGSDFLLGDIGDDRLFGGDADDVLIGGAGADRLLGEAGDDRLFGELGADWLEGGAGADTYIYADAAESTVTSRDRIVGFNADEGDVLDLRQVDANVLTGDVNDAFVLVDRFHGVAGELRIVDRLDGSFMVMGDTNGDRMADFSILMTGVVAPPVDNALVL